MIGEAQIRRDGPAKVTGRARYAYERQADRIAVGFVVGAGIAKGRIASIDLAEALAVPGVIEILTHRNAPRLAARTPNSPGRPFGRPMPVLQDDRVSFFAEPVALVVAETFEAAREAAGRVHIDYAPEAGTFSLDDADVQTFAPETAYGGLPAESAIGDLDAAMESAVATLDLDFTTPHQFAQPLEPQSCVAQWSGDRLKVWASVQIISSARICLAATLQIPQDHIEIDTAFVGGGFGAKLRIHEETILAAVAARFVGRPVKVAQTRRQTFAMAGHRGEMRHRVRLAADAGGRLIGFGHDVNIQCHAREGNVEQTASAGRALYAAPNRLTRHYVTNLDVLMSEAVRGPGEVPGLLVIESAMDELAHAIGMDPVALRLLNEPERDPERGVPFSNRGLTTCMEQGASQFGWSRRSPTPGAHRDGQFLVGMGMSASIRLHFQAETRVIVALRPNGDVVIRSDMTDIGTGTYTILPQVVAEALGVPLERIVVELAHSSLPVSGGSGGSFGASNTASALWKACRGLREQVFVEQTSENRDFLETALRMFPGGVESEGRIVGMGDDPAFREFSIHTYGATFAEVAVDTVTGEIRVRRMLGVFDAGRIINPATARSQLVGGMLWGLSSALLDAAHVDPVHGNIVNCDLAEYLVPVHADMPQIEAVTLDRPDGNANELGIKGVGELGVCGSGAAIANAVFNATGIRARRFPITVDFMAQALAGT